MPKNSDPVALWALKGRIREKRYTYRSLAREIGTSHTCLSNKLNGKADFTGPDIEKIAGSLEIGRDEIGVYFFPKVKNFSQNVS